MKYVLVALESEVPNIDLPDDYTLMITGVGKVNAAMFATLACCSRDCEIIINYGTAGTLKPDLVEQLHTIGKVRQRDMDARPQAPLGTTPFEEASLLQSDITLTTKSKIVLSTGDNFVTEQPEIESDLVDMEGYAIAKVAGSFNKPIVMVKWASDFADDKAPEEWQKNQADGVGTFMEFLKGFDEKFAKAKNG